MQNLTETLDLSTDQQSKIKPIISQETGESSQFLFTTTIPRKERLSRWRKLVRSSDAKMKSVLTQAQWKKLQEIRTGQEKELEALVAAQPNASNN
jgi:dipeptidase